MNIMRNIEGNPVDNINGVPVEKFIEQALEKFDRWFKAQHCIRNSDGTWEYRNQTFTGYVLNENAIRIINHNPEHEPDDVIAMITLELRPELVMTRSMPDLTEHPYLKLSPNAAQTHDGKHYYTTTHELLVLISDDLQVFVPNMWKPHTGAFSVFS